MKSLMDKFHKEDVKVRDVISRSHYDIKVDGVSQNIIMSYLKCRQEFLFRINGWHKEESKMSFANGSITHDTLDKVYTYFQWHRRLPSLTTIKKWIQRYDKDNPDWVPSKNEKEIPKFKALVYVIVTEYIRFYHKDFEKHEILGAEDIFDIMWKGFRLRGKKDLRLRIGDEVWILETKTMARIDEDTLVDKIAFDFQSQFYTHAEEIEFKHSVSGVIYNVIRNPGHKVGVDESLFQFQNRLRREIRKEPEHFFKRWSIPYTKLDKMHFRQELLWKLQEIDAFLHGEIRAFRNEKNCVTRFNCGFLRACASGSLIGYTNGHSMFPELDEKEVRL